MKKVIELIKLIIEILSDGAVSFEELIELLELIRKKNL